MTKNPKASKLAAINRIAKIWDCRLIFDKKSNCFVWISKSIVFADPIIETDDLDYMVLSEWIRDLVHKIDQSI